MIKILFFARLREELACDGLELPCEAGTTVADVIALLSERGEAWRRGLMAANVVIAVNQEVTDRSRLLAAGDELAFFPPVTGG